jgi:hypothetical protein
MINLLFILRIIGISFISSIVAFFIELGLIKFGLVRGNTLLLVILTFILNITVLIALKGESVYLFSLLIIFVGIMSMNRYDLAKTIQKGRWWWKSSDR